MSTCDKSTLVSILRRSDGLFACRMRRAEILRAPTGDQTGGDPELRPAYVESLVPLSDAPEGRREPWRSVLVSWGQLANVRRLDGSALAHVIQVLLHTLPDGVEESAAAPLIPSRKTGARTPTAVHPRGFRGTKERPLKPKGPPLLDLRPHLSGPRGVNGLLLQLSPFQKEAEALLGDLPPLVDGHGKVRDVYLDRFHQAGHESLQLLPPFFRRGFLFGQRGAPWSRVMRVLSLARALNLENRPALRGCVSRLLAHPLTALALEWAEQIPGHPPERQVPLAELLIETDVAVRPPPGGIEALLGRVSDLSPEPSAYHHRMDALLRTLRAGRDPAYLMSGMDLAQDYRETQHFDHDCKGGPVPVDVIRSLVEYTGLRPLGMSLWTACGELEGFDQVLRELPWRELPAPTVRAFLHLFFPARRWEDLRDKVRPLFDLVRGIPEQYQSKACRHLDRLIWYWGDSPDDLEWVLAQCRRLFPRFCRPPFEAENYEERVLAGLTNLDFSDWARIRDGPEELFKAIEEACRRINDADQIAHGIRFLALEDGERLTDGLLTDAGAVLRAAEKLGGLGQSLRHKALNQWTAHPLMHDLLPKLPAEKLVGLILKHLPEELSSSIPRKLKDHVNGVAVLRPKQVERARSAVLVALQASQWRLLGHVCLDLLGRGLRPRSGSAKVIHAIRLYGGIEENRAALRKFLKAHFSGDAEYLRRHPLNQAWLRRRKRLNVQAWLAGMEKEAALKDGSTLRLHVELDPLEALRLGTYVGSCLGLGGINAFSAASNVLDLNKHVVYARTPQGVVVGRQLVAVTKEEQLAVYEVYPGGVSSEIRRHFRDFDLEFAARLGIEIFKPSESTPAEEVDKILSEEWYDDSAWDLKGVDEEPTP